MAAPKLHSLSKCRMLHSRARSSSSRALSPKMLRPSGGKATTGRTCARSQPHTVRLRPSVTATRVGEAGATVARWAAMLPWPAAVVLCARHLPAARWRATRRPVRLGRPCGCAARRAK